MLRPARWLGRLTSPRQRSRADRPARLRQSLPRPESPPARVCYHYSAQPPIAEAGFSPARVSKNEGCTRSKRRQRSPDSESGSFSSCPSIQEIHPPVMAGQRKQRTEPGNTPFPFRHKYLTGIDRQSVAPDTDQNYSLIIFIIFTSESGLPSVIGWRARPNWRIAGFTSVRFPTRLVPR